MSIYMYISTFMYIYIFIYTHKYIETYAYIFMHIYTHIYLCTYIYICLYMYMYIFDIYVSRPFTYWLSRSLALARVRALHLSRSVVHGLTCALTCFMCDMPLWDDVTWRIDTWHNSCATWLMWHDTYDTTLVWYDMTHVRHESFFFVSHAI